MPSGADGRTSRGRFPGARERSCRIHLDPWGWEKKGVFGAALRTQATCVFQTGGTKLQP